MKKILKWFLISLAALFVLVIAAVFLVPLIFKSQIGERAKTEINRGLTATVDFSDYDVTLWRQFPKVTLRMNDLIVRNNGPFEGDTFLYVKGANANLNLWSVLFKDEYEVESVLLDQALIFAKVDSAGNMNWDIVKPDTAVSEPSTGKGFRMAVNSYEINNGQVIYEDIPARIFLAAYNVNHTGKGDFTETIFDLDTETSAEDFTLIYDGVPYLRQVNAFVDTDLRINQDSMKYSFNDAKVRLNALDLTTTGFVAMPSDDILMDIEFAAEQSDFKYLLSMIPAIYTQDFDQLQSSGQATVSGYVKGASTATELPGFGLDINIKNGMFKYPDLPSSINNVNLVAEIRKPQGDLDLMTVNVPNGNIEFGREPFRFSLFLRNMMSDPFIDAKANGVVDLTQLKNSMKLEGIDQLSGIIRVSDLVARGKISSLEEGRYLDFNLAGLLFATNIVYRDQDLPAPLTVSTMNLNFNPRTVDISKVEAKIGQSDISATGKINNLLFYLFKDEALNATVSTNSNYFNLNEWTGTTTENTATASTTTTTNTNTPAASEPYKIPANLDITANATFTKLVYDNIDLDNVRGDVWIHDQMLEVRNLQGNVFGGNVTMKGIYNTAVAGNPDIDFSYNVQRINIAEAFNKLDIMKAIAPVAKYMQGVFSSEMVMKGKLGDDFSPVLNSLTGEGLALVLNTNIKGFKPLEALISELDIRELRDLDLSQIKAGFSFTDGRVAVDPFTIKPKNILMNISGTHGFDQSMAYVINMEVPRSVLGAADQLLVKLRQQAATKGINLLESDVIKFDVLITGTLTDPKLNIGLKEVLQREKEIIEDQVKEQVKDKVKDEVKDKTGINTDSLEAEKNRRIEEEKRRLEAERKRIEDSLKQKGKDKIRDIFK